MIQWTYRAIIFIAGLASMSMAMENQSLKGIVQFEKNKEGAFEFYEGETLIITEKKTENGIKALEHPVPKKSQYHTVFIQGKNDQKYAFMGEAFGKQSILREITKANVLFFPDLEGEKVTFKHLYQTVTIKNQNYPVVETVFYEKAKNKYLSAIQQNPFMDIEKILRNFTVSMLKEILKDLSKYMIKDEEAIKKLNYIRDKIEQKTKFFKKKNNDDTVAKSTEDDIGCLVQTKDLTFTDEQLKKLSPEDKIKKTNYNGKNLGQLKAFGIFMKFRQLFIERKIKNSKKTEELENLGFQFWKNYIENDTLEGKLSWNTSSPLLEKLIECEKQILNSRDMFFGSSKTRYSGLITGLRKYIRENT